MQQRNIIVPETLVTERDLESGTYNGDLVIEEGNLTFLTDCLVKGNIDVVGDVKSNGRLVCNGNIRVFGDMEVQDSLSCVGNVDVGNLFVGNFANVGGNIEVSRGVRVMGALIVGKNLYARGDIAVDGHISAGSNISAAVLSVYGGGVVCRGGCTVHEYIEVNMHMEVEDDLFCGGEAEVGGRLEVGGAIQAGSYVHANDSINAGGDINAVGEIVTCGMLSGGEGHEIRVVPYAMSHGSAKVGNIECKRLLRGKVTIGHLVESWGDGE